MDLQSLPLENLMHILGYVPDSSKYSVLCKKFNHAICLLPNSKRHAIIDDCSLLLTPEFLNNLQYHFGQVSVKCGDVDQFVMELGKYIQKLVVSRDCHPLTPTNVNDILQYTPNCTELYFNNPSEETNGMLPIEEIKVELPNLKRLYMAVYNIRDVIFAEKVLHQHDLDYFCCKFETKKEEMINQVFNILLTTKKDINEVKLIDIDLFFGYYIRLEKLSSLHLDICCDTEDFFCDGIEKLKSLKKLTLTLKQKCEKLSILTSSKLSNLEHFELFCSVETTASIFEDLSAPVLNMKVFKIHNISIQEAKQLEKLLKTFKQLEELGICYWYDENAKNLNFDNFDWQGCYNSNMKSLDIVIPNKRIINLIGSLKASYPSLTTLRVNRVNFIRSNAENEDYSQLQHHLSNWIGFKDILLKYLKMGSKIDTLCTTDRKFAKLSIRNNYSKLTPEKLRLILEFIDRQGKNIKELDICATKLTCEDFWQLFAPLTNCRKMDILIDVIHTGGYVENESAIKSIATGKVEEIAMHLSSFNPYYKAKIMNKFMNLHPKLKKLTLQNEKIAEIKSEYFQNFLSNCSLEDLTWHMYRTFGGGEEILTEGKQTIIKIICRQKKLKILKVEFIMWNELFVEIANNCKELQEFEFYGAEELTPESFFAVQNLRNLRTLSFGHDTRKDSNNFTKLSRFLIGIRNLKLTTLNLFRLSGATQENFIELAALVPSLKSLKIETVGAFEYHPCLILQHFPYLEKFTINTSVRIRNMQRNYSLNVNPNLKMFSNSNLESVLTVNDIKNILKANPNLEDLYIETFKYENRQERPANPEEVTVDDLYGILKVGQKLKRVHISDLIISDPENIEDCQLKQRFESFDYNNGEIRLSSD